MLDTYRLPLTDRKVKEKQAMKQQKAMLIALIVICLTVIVTALVTRKDLCEVRIRTDAPALNPLRRVFRRIMRL